MSENATSQSDRTQRLKYLLRKNDGKQQLKAYLHEYASLFDHTVRIPSESLVSLADTDKFLSQRLKLLTKPPFRQRFHSEHADQLRGLLACMSTKLESQEVVVFSPYAENCGAARTCVKKVLANAFALLLPGKEEITFISSDAKEALSLAQFVDQPDGNFHELIINGATLIAAVQSCSGFLLDDGSNVEGAF